MSFIFKDIMNLEGPLKHLYMKYVQPVIDINWGIDIVPVLDAEFCLPSLFLV